MDEYKKKEFKRWTQAKVNDVVVYNYDPEEDNTNYIGLIKNISQEGVYIDDLYCIENKDENIEEQILINETNVDIFILVKVLYNHKPLLETIQEDYPEFFL